MPHAGLEARGVEVQGGGGEAGRVQGGVCVGQRLRESLARWGGAFLHHAFEARGRT